MQKYIVQFRSEKVIITAQFLWTFFFFFLIFFFNGIFMDIIIQKDK